MEMLGEQELGHIHSLPMDDTATSGEAITRYP
jgi:hypothetical protein